MARRRSSWLDRVLGCLPCGCLHAAVHSDGPSDGKRLNNVRHDAQLNIKVQWALSGEELISLNTLASSDTVLTLRRLVQQKVALFPGSRLYLATDTGLLHDSDTLLGAGVYDGIILQAILENVPLLVGCDDGVVALIDGRTGAELVNFIGHAKAVRSICSSADGSTILTGSEDSTAAVWNAATGGRERLLLGHAGEVVSVNFISHSDSAVTGSYDTTARVWNFQIGHCKQILQHPAQVAATAVSQDGNIIATGCRDHRVRLWNFSDGGYTNNRVLEGHRGTIRSISFCRDGQHLLSAAFDSQIKLFDYQGSCQRSFEDHGRAVVSLNLAPNSDCFVSGSADASAKLWSIDGGCLKTLPRDSTQGSVPRSWNHLWNDNQWQHSDYSFFQSHF